MGHFAPSHHQGHHPAPHLLVSTAQSKTAFALNSSSWSQSAHSASGIVIYVLHQARQPLLDAKVLKSSPIDTSGYTIQYRFHIDEGHMHFVDGMEIFCSCRKIGMALVVPGLGMTQNCMSPMRTCCHMKFSANLSKTVMALSRNLKPR